MLKLEKMTLHVRFNGQSEELELGALGLHANPSDAELRVALARRYDCSEAVLKEYVIVREAQAIIVRPIAFYG